MNPEESLSKRKSDHLNLAVNSQVGADLCDPRFTYEPLLSGHPQDAISEVEARFGQTWAGKKLKAPLWISSMTGGTGEAREINQRLARVAGEFGLGMGLGSCRPLLESEESIKDFQLRPFLGAEALFMANIGIAQIEQLIEDKELSRLEDLVGLLQTDGLIVHVNPLQEWFQPEGDRFKRPPIDSITELAEKASYPIIVKEVGQGMGPMSLRALMKLPLLAVDFGAFGGTNFSQLEVLRDHQKKMSPFVELTRVGHTADEMVYFVNKLLEELGDEALCRSFIISGGISSALQGMHLMEKLEASSVYGQAKAFLSAAHAGEEELRGFVKDQLTLLAVGARFLGLRSEPKGEHL